MKAYVGLKIAANSKNIIRQSVYYKLKTAPFLLNLGAYRTFLTGYGQQSRQSCANMLNSNVSHKIYH